MLHFRWNKKSLIIIFLSVLFFVPRLYGRPDFNVFPKNAEVRLGDNTYVQLDIYNSRDLGADEDLEWSLQLFYHDDEDTDWASATRAGGVVRPGRDHRTYIGMDRDNLEADHAYVDVVFTTNDPTREEFTVPMAAHQADYPRIVAAWSEDWDIEGIIGGIDLNRIFGEIYYGEIRSFQVRISNPGSAELEIERIRSDNGYWVVEPDSFNLEGGSNRNITITFTAEDIEQNSGTITSTSNAWDPREVNFRVLAEVLPIFELVNPIEDITLDEDSGEILIADLDTVFVCSNRGIEYEAEAIGLQTRIERNGEFFLTPNANYFGETDVLLNAINGDSSLSDTFGVIVSPVNDAPGAFDLLLPSFGDTNVDDDSIFYELQIWTDNDEPPFLFPDLIDTTHSIMVLDGILDAQFGGKFYWTVGATDKSLTTDAWSEFEGFIVSNSVDNNTDLLPDDFSIIRAYPNPFNSHAKIEYEVGKARKLEVSIVDLAGRTVLAEAIIPNRPGLHELNINASDWSTGVYLVKFSSVAGSRMVKIVCLK